MSEEAVVVEEEVGAEAPVEEVVETPVEESAQDEVAFSDSFIEKLTDEDLKSNKTWDRLKGKSADELGRYITELVSYNGKKGDIPAKDASKEEWDAFHQKMGRPESVEGYDFSIGDEFKEVVGEANLPYYQQMIDGFKEQAFEQGMSAEASSNMVEWYLDKVAGDVTGVSEIAKKSTEASEAALDKEWGEQRQSIEGAINAMLQKSGADIDALKATGALSDPSIAIPLGKLASQFADDPEIGHNMTQTVTGLHDQMANVTKEVGEYIRRGDKVPAHLSQKRLDIMNRLGDNL